MSTTLQLIAVVIVVAVAVGYIARATWRTWFSTGKAGCGSGCGKCASHVAETEAAGRRSLPMV